MYYSYNDNFRRKTYHFVAFSFLFAIFFLNILETPGFAVDMTNASEEYRAIGYKAQQEGDFERALTFYAKSISMSGDDAWIYPLLIEALNEIDPTYHENVVETQLEETDQRLYQMAQEELSLDVARADGHYRHAGEFLGNAQFQEAVVEIDKALSLTPNNPKIKKMKEQILSEQRRFEIKQKAQKAVEFLDSGDMDSARQEFQKILTILPGESVQE